MAKTAAKTAPKTAAKKVPRDREAVRIRWERRNVALITAGLASVALGYVLLSQGDITAAPLLLVVGYCVLIPLAFIV
jgi:hypothetical protein